MTKRPYTKRQTFRLYKNGETLSHFYRNHEENQDEVRDILQMYDDFDALFPWLCVYGFGGPGGVGFHEIWSLNRPKKTGRGYESTFEPAGPPYNMPEEVMYTMLKLKGADVSRYGFTEVWENEE
jgi:hypothetical protein